MRGVTISLPLLSLLAPLVVAAVAGVVTAIRHRPAPVLVPVRVTDRRGRR